MNSKEKLTSCMQINKRMNPVKQEQNLSALCYIGDEIQQELLQRLDFCLKVLTDPTTGQEYIGCEYNRDEDSYRSPFSNEYYPSLSRPSELMPSKYLRELEVKANQLLDQYRKQYYDGGVSSTYVWNKDKEGNYGLCFCVVKEEEGLKWNSINLLEVRRNQAKREMSFKIQTTVFIQLSEPDQPILTGSLQRAKEDTITATDDQLVILAKIGSMIEDIETSMRKNLDSIYVNKTQDIIFRTRSLGGNNPNQDNLKRELMELTVKHKAK